MMQGEEVVYVPNSVVAIWSTILTAGLAAMGYFAKKRDDKIDSNDKAVTALELKMAEKYATKDTVMALFQEATTQTKEAVARVEKSVDSTNLSVGKVDLKIDKVFESLSTMQSDVMKELAKKT